MESRKKTKSPPSRSRRKAGSRTASPVSGAVSDKLVAICAIISKNRIAYARTLVDSFLRHHPKGKAFVLVMDEIGNSFRPRSEKFQTIRLQDLKKDYPFVTALSFKYDPLELSCALKPILMEHLLRKEGLETLFYVDTDMLFLGSLDPVLEEMQGASVYLTPHQLRPYGDSLSGLIADSQRKALVSGTYNAGFVGVNRIPHALEFLEWWKNRLMLTCRMNKYEGLFHDQKWLDLAPALFTGVKVSDQPGLNVAHWRLHERQISVENGVYRAGSSPLILFHFSGFLMENPGAISHFLHGHPWLMSINTRETVVELCKLYAEQLLENRYKESMKWPYTLGFFDNGVSVNYLMRTLYDRLNPLGERFPEPFEAGGQKSFFNWMLDDSEAGVPPLVLQMRNVRLDILAAHPDPLGADREHLMNWAVEHGCAEFGIDPKIQKVLRFARDYRKRQQEAIAQAPGIRQEKLKRPIRSKFQKIQTASSPVGFGVNLIGYMDSEKSFGAVARGDELCLRQTEVPFTVNNVREPNATGLEELTGRYPNIHNPYYINLIVQTPPALIHLLNQYPDTELGDGRYNIVSWAWEFPNMHERDKRWFSHFDEFWVPSTFIQNALAPHCPVPVIVMPHALKESVFNQPKDGFDFASRGIQLKPDDHVFLFCFDFHSYWKRKNPDGLIRAFKKAFSPKDNAVLIMKSIHAEDQPEAAAFLRELARGSRIHFIDEILSEADVARLMSSCRTYVSLHRSEGFGLTLFEAMALGKTAIGTAYSGNVDFMNQRNSYLVGYENSTVPENYRGVYYKGDPWAEPNLAEAAAIMKHVHENPEEAGRKAEAGARDIRGRYSAQAIAKLMELRIRAIQKNYFQP